MSRGDFGYGSTSRYGGSDNVREYRDNPFGPGDQGRHTHSGNFSSYNASVDKISSNIFTISNNATTLERAVKQIGTTQDSVQLRDKIHDTEKTTNRVIADTVTDLQRFSHICSDAGRQQKLQYERLRNEFKESVERYNIFQKSVAERVKSSVMLSTPSRRSHPKNLIDWGETKDDEERLIQNDEQRAQMLAQEQTVELDLALMQEREEQIRQLESDILDINEIFRDLGTLVHEQGETIDSIEDNVSNAAANVESGNEQLERAAYYQRKSRKKICILITILLIIVAIIVTVIAVEVKKK